MNDYKQILVALLPWLILFPLLAVIWTAVQRRRHPPSQETIESAALLSDRRWLSSGLAAFAFTGVYESASLVERLASPHGALKIALLTVPVLAFSWFMNAYIGEVRKGDEFARRVQLHALSFAVPAFLCLMMVMWLGDEIWPAEHHIPFSGGLAFLTLYYAVGVFFSKMRFVPTHKDRP